MAPTLYTILALATLLTSTYALPPWWPHAFRNFFDHQNRHNSSPDPDSLAFTTEEVAAKQPLSCGGDDSLTSNADATLMHIALGLGIQNYTCPDTSSDDPEFTATGAIATLFDVTAFHQKGLTNTNSSDIPAVYLDAYEHASCSQDPDCLDDNFCEEGANMLDFDVIGKHYFRTVDGAGVPYFDLGDETTISCGLEGKISAPAGAYGGANGEGAVAWLYLTSDESERTSGLSNLYRINTVGGSPTLDQCEGKAEGDEISVKYAAEYWFYD